MGGCATGTNGGTANGTKIEWHRCNGKASQVWVPQANSALLNTKTGKCLDDPGSSTTAGAQHHRRNPAPPPEPSTTAGTQLQLRTGDNTSAQVRNVP